jgi:hypothetical protein
MCSNKVETPTDVTRLNFQADYVPRLPHSHFRPDLIRLEFHLYDLKDHFGAAYIYHLALRLTSVIIKAVQRHRE